MNGAEIAKNMFEWVFKFIHAIVYIKSLPGIELEVWEWISILASFGVFMVLLIRYVKKL